MTVNAHWFSTNTGATARRTSDPITGPMKAGNSSDERRRVAPVAEDDFGVPEALNVEHQQI
ncbi:hypothetical protein BRC82_05820 [Halobacteriales archaeon QS_1_67_19]|nr:MAG: hypothetical protein BRC82_05820 [Halobacteriales archaeon QS_1_67_19]